MKNKEHALMGYDNELERPDGDRIVTMSNALTRAGHGLTLTEKRLIAICVSRLDSRARVDPMNPPVSKVRADEYAELFGVDINAAYEALQTASKQLYNRSITFYEAAHNRRGKAIAPTRVQMRWVGQVKYHEGEGWVELHWWHKVVPHLTGLQKQFTSYKLHQASALRSMYSWRLLELLMRFKDNGWAEYTIEDFCASMDATEKQRADFAAIRRKIIEPAVKELTQKDGWEITWETIKAGRKVRAVRFTFKRNIQLKLF